MTTSITAVATQSTKGDTKGKVKGGTKNPAKLAAKLATTPTSTIKFALVDYARPTSGARLFAHTAAFLTLSGIEGGQAYPTDKARKVIGSTAFKYHSHNGNFETTKEGLKLTQKGIAFFNARGAQDPELVAAYSDVFATGNVNDKANVKATSSRIALK